MALSKGVIKGLVIAPAIALGIGFLFYLLSLVFDMPKSQAAEWPFPAPPYIFVGIDYEINNAFCDKSKGKLAGNVGFGQVLWVNGNWSMPIEYHHHSCAFTRDIESYDALGVKLKWSPWR